MTSRIPLIEELRQAFKEGAEDVHIFWAGKCRLHVTAEDFAALDREHASLEAELERRTQNPADYRYWEARYRDEAAEVDRLKAEILELTAKILFIGWRLVPTDPTEEMLAEINLTGTFTDKAMRARYAAMLSKAPSPPDTEDGQ